MSNVYDKSLKASFGYAFEGVFHAVRFNRNFKIHLSFALLAIFLSLLLKINPFEMGIIGVMIIIVFVTEMMNTAIEEMVNLITSEHRKEAKIAKDVAAGMVLVASIGAVIIGVLIFTPYLFKLL